jgi:hypothetical protein
MLLAVATPSLGGTATSIPAGSARCRTAASLCLHDIRAVDQIKLAWRAREAGVAGKRGTVKIITGVGHGTG